MRAGSLDQRVRFEKLERTPDGGGGHSERWVEYITVWGGFTPERARERIEAGRLATLFAGVLRIRWSPAASLIGQPDRVIIGGIAYNIRSAANPDQRRAMLEFGVETDGS